MIVIPPDTIDDSNLQSSTIAEPTVGVDPPLWVSGRGYLVGDTVYLTSTHKVYMAVTVINAGSQASTVSPATDINLAIPKWSEIGSTNRWNMFDVYRNTTTIVNDSTATVVLGGAYTTVAVETEALVAEHVWNTTGNTGTWTFTNTDHTAEVTGGAGTRSVLGKLLRNRDKRYIEIVFNSGDSYGSGVRHDIGISSYTVITPNIPSGDTGLQFGFGYRRSGHIYKNGVLVQTVTALSSGDVVGIAFNLETGDAWISRNGTWTQGDPSTNTSPIITGMFSSNLFYPFMTSEAGAAMKGSLRARESEYTYPIPTGFISWAKHVIHEGKWNHAPVGSWTKTNLDTTAEGTAGAYRTIFADGGKSTGKYYFEAVLESGTAPATTTVYDVGLAQKIDLPWIPRKYANHAVYRLGGSIRIDDSSVFAPSSIAPLDVIGVAVDFDNDGVWFSKNGTWVSGNPSLGTSPFTTNFGGTVYPMVTSDNINIKVTLRSILADFAYPMPTGFLSWAGGSIDVAPSGGPPIYNKSLALLNLENVGSVQVITTYYNGTNEIEVGNNTYYLNTRNVYDWWTYFTTQFTPKKSLVLERLPDGYPDLRVTIIFKGSNPMSIGTCIIGKSTFIGRLEHGAELDILNFSTMERDTFGNAILVSRKEISTLSAKLFVDKKIFEDVMAIRNQLDAKPAVWVGISSDSDPYYNALIFLGIYRDFNFQLDNPIGPTAVLELEEM